MLHYTAFPVMLKVFFVDLYCKIDQEADLA